MALSKGIVFDLDDTLYPEREYVRSGFLCVSRLIEARETACHSDDVFSYLWTRFESGTRGDAFNQLFQAYPQLSGQFRIDELVAAYRAHLPDLRLFDGIESLLRNLRSAGVNVGLLSDGPLVSQTNKTEALFLRRYLSPIVLTDRWGTAFWKPHERGYLHIADEWGLPPGELTYVGDNPDRDFVTPRALGWRTIRLRLEAQLRSGKEPPSDAHAAEMNVSDIAELSAILLGKPYECSGLAGSRRK